MSVEADRPMIHVVILHYMNADDTLRCIESLLSCGYDGLELIVVDNASPNDSFETIQRHSPGHTYIQTGHNLGNAGGLNAGVRHALSSGAQLILLSDNDMIYTPGCLSPLAAALSGDPTIGIASPKILYAHDPTLIYCAGGEMSWLLCGGTNRYRGRRTERYGAEDRDITMAEGCCFLVRHEVFEEAGLLDERFFMYFEDAEFSVRARRRYRIRYVHRSVVHHKCGAGRAWKDFSPLYYYYHTRNRFMFFRDARPLYRLYVSLFATATVCVKSAVLLLALMREKDTARLRASLRALWKGYREGTRLVFRHDVRAEAAPARQ